MNDSNKYRLWDEENKIMHYTDFVITSTGFVAKVEEVSPNVFQFDQTDLEFDKKMKEMRCTGLKDSKNKLIYERDIVNFVLFYFNGNEDDLDLNGIIRWSDCLLSYYIEVLNTTKDFKCLEDDDEEGNKSVEIYHLNNGSAVSILGNEFENPELLEGE